MVRPQPPEGRPEVLYTARPHLESELCADTFFSICLGQEKRAGVLGTASSASTESFPSVSLPVKGGGPGSDTPVRPHRGQGLGSEHCPA